MAAFLPHLRELHLEIRSVSLTQFKIMIPVIVAVKLLELLER